MRWLIKRAFKWKNAAFARPICPLSSKNQPAYTDYSLFNIARFKWPWNRERGRPLNGKAYRLKWVSEDVLVLIAVTTHHHLSLSAYLGNLTGNYCRFSNQIKHIWPLIVPPKNHRIRAWRGNTGRQFTPRRYPQTGVWVQRVRGSPITGDSIVSCGRAANSTRRVWSEQLRRIE